LILMKLPDKLKSYLLINVTTTGRYAQLVILLAILISCDSPRPTNKFSNDVFVSIADFQDRRLTDSLFAFLENINAEYRRAAVLAFASLQDPRAVEPLGKIFTRDSDASVRASVAFALGQIGGAKAFEYLNSKPNPLDPVISEAWAKVSVEGSTPIELTSWGLYRLTLRNQATETHVAEAMAFLDLTYDEDIRLGAAHFFGRGTHAIAAAEAALLNALKNDPSPLVRMAVASSLRKIKTAEVQHVLIEAFRDETDYRVRVNLVRALQPYPLRETAEVFANALADEQINVAIAASEIIRQTASAPDYSWIAEKARAAKNWRVKANVYEAALSVTGSQEISEEIMQACYASANPYERAALIAALSHAPLLYEFVYDQLQEGEVPVIRSTSASTLVSMNRHKAFSLSMQQSFFEMYKQIILTSDDAAVIGTIASAFADSTLGYKNITSDFGFLYEAKQKLSLPRDNEALQPLEAAIAFIEGKKHAPNVKNEFNHPIDWEFVKTIPRDQRVLIRTDKGNIVMELFVEEAPGSVANFLQLAKSGYFNSKNFHRVVPNFVIQGGCNRGDGWGSEDYSIRSEFSMRKYKEGSVGMASAGKDTEGTQWFITHSPTPHLDGRYTIFAEVITGMDVVHRIEVGDVILSVEILNP
jgi:cyclophilin family peptidyl-prolyl cis-trans isomerase/HEAT repeat protein